AGVEALDRLDEPERGDLHEVVERLVRPLVATGQLAGQGQVALHEGVAQLRAALSGVLGEEDSLLVSAVDVVLHGGLSARRRGDRARGWSRSRVSRPP